MYVDKKERLNAVGGMKTGPATMTTRIEVPHKAKLTTTVIQLSYSWVLTKTKLPANMLERYSTIRV